MSKTNTHTHTHIHTCRLTTDNHTTLKLITVCKQQSKPTVNDSPIHASFPNFNTECYSLLLFSCGISKTLEELEDLFPWQQSLSNTVKYIHDSKHRGAFVRTCVIPSGAAFLHPHKIYWFTGKQNTWQIDTALLPFTSPYLPSSPATTIPHISLNVFICLVNPSIHIFGLRGSLR